MLSYLDSIKRKIEKISRDFHETRRGVDLTSEKGKKFTCFFGIKFSPKLHLMILMDFNFFLRCFELRDLRFLCRFRRCYCGESVNRGFFIDNSR